VQIASFFLDKFLAHGYRANQIRDTMAVLPDPFGSGKLQTAKAPARVHRDIQMKAAMPALPNGDAP
jgi:hypothetical protein